MNNASLELGGTNWAEKDASLLGYTVSDDSGRFFPQEFTFARGSNLAATRIGKTGLIEKGRENLLVQSNQFDTTWVSSGTTETSGQSGYDGLSDAWLLSAPSVNNFLYRNDVTSFSGVNTISLYAKKGTTDGVRLRFKQATDANIYINLINGSDAASANGVISHNVTSLTNGWYRIEMTFSVSSPVDFRIYPANSSGSHSAGTIFIQDAQLEQGLAASPYIPTTTTTAQAGVLENTPRLNYTTGVANPYLLLEPSRTNFIDSSEYAGSWAGINANITKTDNATTSPEGVDNAVKLEGLTTSSSNQIVNFGTTVLNGINVVGKTYTASVYIKPVNPSDVGDDIVLSIQRNSGDYEGLNVTTEITSSDWKRYDLTYTFTGAGAGNQVGANFKILRNDTTIDDIYVYGAQFEESFFLTSYIPTYSVSATRVYDYTKFIDLQSKGIITASQGTLLIEMDNYNNGSVQFDVQNNNLAYALRPKFSSSDQNIFQRVNGVQTTVRTITGLPAGRRRCAISWNGTSLITSVNGVSYTDTIDGSIAAELFKIDRPNFNGTIFDLNQLLMFSTQLTEAELNTLTTL